MSRSTRCTEMIGVGVGLYSCRGIGGGPLVDAILFTSDLCAIETTDECLLTVKAGIRTTVPLMQPAIAVSSDGCVVQTLDGCVMAVMEPFYLLEPCEGP